jgi:formate dehydrogenase subunit delta
MHIEKLVKMANDISAFFGPEPDRLVAAQGVVDHLRKFWEPRMRAQIIAYLHDEGGVGLSDLAKEAIQFLEKTR